MVAIHTKRNVVAALDPIDGDLWVETLIGGCGPALTRLSLQPIDQYQGAVDWAVGIADQMEYPIHVVPLGIDCLCRTDGDRLQSGLDSMTDQERGALRRHVVMSVAQVMRDCDDLRVRTRAHEVLLKLKLIER